tara:strand:+ start:6654 stop:7211 length:558 start_codon:yes stop_codon:yes gene_type:complete
MSFTDTKGRDWRVSINVGTMAAVKRETGMNLAEAIKPSSDVIETISSDPSVFFDVLTVILRRQLDEKSVSIDEFAEGLDDEDVAIEAMKSLIEGIIDFFPKDRSLPLKKAFNRLWSATEKKATAQAAAAMSRLEDLDVEAMADEILSQTMSSGSSTSSTSGSLSSLPQASSGSNPGASLSESSSG